MLLTGAHVLNTGALASGMPVSGFFLIWSEVYLQIWPNEVYRANR
jgi:hypothetical protein